MFPLSTFYYFEIGTFFLSVVAFYRFRNKPLHWFIPFLFFIVCIELTGRYFRRVLHEPNSWLYNISMPIEYLFYGFIIAGLCISAKSKKIIFTGMVLLAVIAIINILWIQGFMFPNTITYKTGCSLMIISACIGLIDLFRYDEHVSLLKNPLFWICTGVLFFNVAEFTTFFLIEIFMQKKWQITKIFTLVNNNMIYVLYTCISLAILTTIKWKKQ